MFTVNQKNALSIYWTTKRNSRRLAYPWQTAKDLIMAKAFCFAGASAMLNIITTITTTIVMETAPQPVEVQV